MSSAVDPPQILGVRPGPLPEGRGSGGCRIALDILLLVLAREILARRPLWFAIPGFIAGTLWLTKETEWELASLIAEKADMVSGIDIVMLAVYALSMFILVDRARQNARVQGAFRRLRAAILPLPVLVFLIPALAILTVWISSSAAATFRVGSTIVRAGDSDAPGVDGDWLVLLAYSILLLATAEAIRDRPEAGDDSRWFGAADLARRITFEERERIDRPELATAIFAHHQYGEALTRFLYPDARLYPTCVGAKLLEPPKAFLAMVQALGRVTGERQRVHPYASPDAEDRERVVDGMLGSLDIGGRDAFLASIDGIQRGAPRHEPTRRWCAWYLLEPLRALATAGVDPAMLANRKYARRAVRHYQYVIGDCTSRATNTHDSESVAVPLVALITYLGESDFHERVQHSRWRTWSLLRYALGSNPQRSMVRRYQEYCDAALRGRNRHGFSMWDIVRDAVALTMLENTVAERRDLTAALDDFRRLLAAMRAESSTLARAWLGNIASTLALAKVDVKLSHVPQVEPSFESFLGQCDDIAARQESFQRRQFQDEERGLLVVARSGRMENYERVVVERSPFFYATPETGIAALLQRARGEDSDPALVRPNREAAALNGMAVPTLIATFLEVRSRFRAIARPAGYDETTLWDVIALFSDHQWDQLALRLAAAYTSDRYAHLPPGNFAVEGGLLDRVSAMLRRRKSTWWLRRSIGSLRRYARNHRRNVPALLALAECYLLTNRTLGEGWTDEIEWARECAWRARGYAEAAIRKDETMRSEALLWIGAADMILSRASNVSDFHYEAGLTAFHRALVNIGDQVLRTDDDPSQTAAWLRSPLHLRLRTALLTSEDPVRKREIRLLMSEVRWILGLVEHAHVNPALADAAARLRVRLLRFGTGG